MPLTDTQKQQLVSRGRKAFKRADLGDAMAAVMVLFIDGEAADEGENLNQDDMQNTIANVFCYALDDYERLTGETVPE
jgi:hypothetical protein